VKDQRSNQSGAPPCADIVIWLKQQGTGYQAHINKFCATRWSRDNIEFVRDVPVGLTSIAEMIAEMRQWGSGLCNAWPMQKRSVT
jgi:hypothetical protein